jgi:hypothetical protein
MASVTEFPMEFWIIVNLPVQHHPDTAVFIGDGLMAPCHVDNAQSAKSETDAGAHVYAFVVWTAVDYRVGHATYELAANLLLIIKLKNPTNSTHLIFLRSLSPYLDSSSGSEFQV